MHETLTAAEVVATLERIADSYCAQGYFEIALEKWQRVLAILTGQAAAQADGPSGGARPAAEAAAAGTGKVLGEPKEIARVLNTMGLILADLQRYDEALQYYQVRWGDGG